MKYLSILLCGIIFSMQHATAQDTYCGLTYSYDAFGNRIQRAVTTDCGPYTDGSSGGGGMEALVVQDSTNTPSSTPGLTEALYPNPTTGSVSILFNNPVTEAQITVTDNLGRQLYITTTSGSIIPLDMSSFAEGMYYIVVRTQGNVWQSTVVKQ